MSPRTVEDSTLAATAARRNATRRKPSGDTIDVKQRLAAVSISDSDEGIGARTARRRSSNRRTSAGEPNRPWGRKGKAPSRPSVLDDIDSDDAVEEYVFTSDDDLDEDEDDSDDARSVITLSSESSAASEARFDPRPWKDFSTAAREQWEMMYSNVTMHPLNGNWEVTEDYQREKDAEMLRYMEDFPLNQWIIPHEEANQAYFRLLERTRWRSLGIRIYGRERIPEWIPGSTTAARLQQPLNTPDDKYPREPRPESSRSGEHLQGEPQAGAPSRSSDPNVHLPPRPNEPPRSGPTPPQHAMPPHLPPLHQLQHSPHSLPQQQHQPPHPQQHPQGPPPHLAHGPPLGHPGFPGPGQAPHPGLYPPQFHGPHPGHHGPPLGIPGHHFPHPPPPPPPPHALPSQPYAQPMPVPPGPLPPPGVGRPVGPPQHMPYLSNFPPHPSHMMHQTPYPPPAAPKARRGRDKKESPIPSTPPPPPPTPPYVMRQKPVEKKVTTKAGRRSARRQAEAEEFPWTRSINFREAKEKATWNDKVYDAETLDVLERTRARNVPVIDELDAKVQEQQRLARAAKKNKDKKGENAESSDTEPPKPGEKKKMQRGQRKVESHGDPYHSGAFAFASEEDEQKAADLGYKTPDEALEAGEAGKLDPEVQATIKIYWNPGKKGMTENLEQIKFTLKDTLVTRKQLETTPILTKRAAECIVDFCPDMLWRGMLLRICSEAGYGNKDVRDRFCYNGCYCDKATITKRISAALGQKQVQPKSKGYGPGEWEWYDENVKDFAKYIDYFGKRTSHRNMLKIQMQGEKRKMKEREEREARKAAGLQPEGDGEGVASEEEKAGPSKRSRGDAAAPVGSEGPEAEDAEDGGHESEGSEDSNAVSVQDSDILDKMED